MRKIQFGCGSMLLPAPWENYDMDVDISKPLDRARFPDACASVVFSEMAVEHITPREAFAFLEECHRILVPGGLIRIVIPDFSLTWRLKDPEYARVNGGVTGAKTWSEHMRSIVFCHGHQGLWNSQLMQDVLESIGFTGCVQHRAGESSRPEFVDIEHHWHSVGRACAYSESGCVEGQK